MKTTKRPPVARGYRRQVSAGLGAALGAALVLGAAAALGADLVGFAASVAAGTLLGGWAGRRLSPANPADELRRKRMHRILRIARSMRRQQRRQNGSPASRWRAFGHRKANGHQLRPKLYDGPVAAEG